MVAQISALTSLRAIARDRHQYATTWKARTGGRVIGSLCTYVPEELFAAAGLLVVRLFPGEEPLAITEPHIYSMYCPFSRGVLAEALAGRYSYVDGITKARTCHHVRNTYVSWREHLPTSFEYYIPMPTQFQGRHAQSYVAGEYAALRQAIEEYAGVALDDAALDRAFEVMNTNRRLLRQLYKLRNSDPPKVSGPEVMDLVIASQVMDKAEYNALLGDALAELEGRGNQIRSGTRLMLIGGESDDVRFLELVESLGANVVIDDTCTGSRYFWNEIAQGKDRLTALASRYLERPFCPYKDYPERRRIPHLLGLAREYGVRGAILYQQKFCDPHEFDLPVIQKAFEEQNLPCLALEFDVTIPLGQFRTRIEAFLETLELDLL